MFCTNCGSKLPEGARFCSVCGVRVAETEPEEKVTVAPLDLDFSEVKPAEAPMKTRVTFDWSNVIDEPHRKNTETIKSPWETSGSVEEKDVLAEMEPSTDRSRTMSFIDVLKAEKEQQAATLVEEKPVEEPISTLEEMIAEDAEQSQGFDYTEVLDPGYLDNAIEEKKEEVVEREFVEPEMPELHVAPLFDDVDEPVKSPFDEEASTEPVFEEPEFEEPAVDAEEPVEDFAEEVEEFAEVEEVAEEVADEVEETEEATVEEPAEESKEAWFEMPDFLKPREDRVAFEEAPVIEAHEVEIPAVEKNVGNLFPETEEVEETAAADDSAIAEVDFVEELQKVLEENTPSEETEEVVEETVEPVEEVAEVVEEVAEEVEAPVEEETTEEVEVPTLDVTEVEEAPVEEVVEVEAPTLDVEDVEAPTLDFSEVEEATEEVVEEPVVEETEETVDEAVDSLVDEYDDYMNIETEQRVGRGHRSEQYEDEFDDDDDEDDEYDEEVEVVQTDVEPETYDEVPEYEEEDFDASATEEEIFGSMELPKHSGMTIAAPADRESEIEALKARLAELMGETVETPAEEEPVAEEVEEVAEAVEEVTPVEETVEESVDAIVNEYAEEPVVEAEPEVVEETVEPVEEVAEVVEEVVEEVEAPVEEATEEVVESVAPTFDEDVITDHGFEDELAAYLSMDDPTVEKAEEHTHAVPEEDFEEVATVEETVEESVDAIVDAYTEEPAVEAEPEVVEETVEPVEEVAEVVEEVAEEVEAPVEEATEEVVEEPVAEEPVVEEPAEPSIDDILAAVLKEAAIPASETVAAVPAVDLVPEVEVPAVEEVSEPVAEVVEEAAPEVVEEAVEAVEEPEFVVPTLEELVNEPVAEEVVEEPAVEEPVAEEVATEEVAEETAPEEKETDAVSLEDLEKDLFGTAPEDETEAEVTKKIDKFYTLYRKNEEFQRLLDEEYNKLKAAGGTAPEPVLPDLEPQRPVEDATIYQPLDKPLEELAKEEAAKAAAKAEEVKAEAKPVVKAEEVAEKPELKDAAIPVAAVAGAAATALAAETKGQGPEVEYEEVDKGGTFLTVLAVVIALLLVVLLAVLLILNLAPTSGAAIWIDSIIENISSHFTAVDGSITEYLL